MRYISSALAGGILAVLSTTANASPQDAIKDNRNQRQADMRDRSSDVNAMWNNWVSVANQQSADFDAGAGAQQAAEDVIKGRPAGPLGTLMFLGISAESREALDGTRR